MRRLVTLSVDAELWKKFSEYVYERYGNGKVSATIEMLIQMFLNMDNNDNINTQEKDVIKSIVDKIRQLHIHYIFGEDLHLLLGLQEGDKKIEELTDKLVKDKILIPVKLNDGKINYSINLSKVS